MATAQQDSVTVDKFGVYIYPRLNSNFSFLDAHQVANEASIKTIEHLRKLGYTVVSLQPPIHAGGTGWLPGLFEVMQAMWENKSIITVPFAVVKGMWKYYSINKNMRMLAKLQSNTPEMDIEVQFTSNKLLPPGGYQFIERKGILSSMFNASNEALNYLMNEYPHIRFNQIVEIDMEKYMAKQSFHLSHGQKTLKHDVKLIKLFETIPLTNNTFSNVTFLKFGFLKRIDSSYDNPTHNKKTYIVYGAQRLIKDLRASLKN